MENNKHIIDFLNYYCELPVPPGYAILIKGPWGSGKTKFIKDFKDAYENDIHDVTRKFIYVSLYGVSSFLGIEQAIFQQLHPLLGSKTAMFFGRFAKNTLKATTKIDLDSNGSNETEVNIKIPDFSITDYLLGTNETIFIFDDLERCSIELTKLLGYVNSIVEHKEGKVIFLAEEKSLSAKIKKDKVNKNDYSVIKEKLIGKTFEFVSDPVSAFDEFVNQINDENLKDTLINNKELIINIFKQSKCENLRRLRHAIMDFNRLYSFLPDKAQKNTDCVIGLCKLFMIFFYEIKDGKIEVDKILESSKYTGINSLALILNMSDWHSFLDKGYCDLEAVKKAIDNSEYFINRTSPAWVKLWHWRDLGDDEFKTVIGSVKNDLSNKKFNDLHVIKHVTGILISLSQKKLIDESKTRILKDAKLYIQHLLNDNALANMELSDDTFGGSSGWGGLGYHALDSKEFLEFSKYLKTKKKQANKNKLPQLAEDLLALLDNGNTKEFLDKVCVTVSGTSQYYKTPILKYIDVSSFVEAVTNIPNNRKRDIEIAISLRYEASYRQSLKDERAWLEKVNKQIKRKTKGLNTVTSAVLNEFNESISKILANWSAPPKKIKLPKQVKSTK